MKVRAVSLIVSIVLISCKTSLNRMSQCPVVKNQLRSSIVRSINLERFGENPLIIKDGNIYKRYSEIDSLELDTTWIQFSKPLTINKNSKYIISLLGSKAEDGVFILNTKRAKKSKSTSKLIYLIDGKITNKKEFKRTQKRNETRLDYFISNLKVHESIMNIINVSTIDSLKK
ncbi:hypothetical protein [Lacinutrix chionoecetis]